MLYAALILETVEVVLEVALKVLAVLYMTEVVNGVRCVLWVLAVMLSMLFCILDAAEGAEVLE